jgi:membrane associated rhomboid family serine protease
MSASPLLSLLLLGVLLVLGVLGLTAWQNLPNRLMFRPWEFARGRRRWSLVTAGFAHADLPHLIFNCMTLWFFGPGLEQVVGSTRFGLLYACGLAFSQWLTYARHRDEPSYATLGASGAISAVVFASIVYRPLERLMILPLPVPIPAPLFAVGYLAYSWWSARAGRGHTNHDAHLGGALAGLIFVALTDPAAYQRAALALGLT